MSYSLPTFDLKNPKKIYNDIIQKPILLSYFYIYLFKNFKNIDFSNFGKNIQILSKKINSLTPKINFDMHNCLSCIFGAFLGDSLGVVIVNLVKVLLLIIIVFIPTIDSKMDKLQMIVKWPCQRLLQ